MRILVCFVALTIAPRAFAGTDDACQEAFKNLKAAEAANVIPQSDSVLTALMKDNPCDPKVIEWADKADARAEQIAPLAKEFVDSCRDGDEHADDVAEYDHPDIIDPASSSLRQSCAPSGK